MVTHALAFPSRRAVAVHIVEAGEAAGSLTMSSSSAMFRAIVLIVIVHAVCASGTTFPVPLVLDGIESCARSAVATADSGFETNRDIDYALDGDGDSYLVVDRSGGSGMQERAIVPRVQFNTSPESPTLRLEPVSINQFYGDGPSKPILRYTVRVNMQGLISRGWQTYNQRFEMTVLMPRDTVEAMPMVVLLHPTQVSCSHPDLSAENCVPCSAASRSGSLFKVLQSRVLTRPKTSTRSFTYVHRCYH